jgi:hypothetical protein
MIRPNSWALALVATATLAACGGGGSDAPATLPVSASVTIAGTAAKGAALAGATVSVKCAAGNGNATTGSDGKYTVTITGANLPCALRVAATDGTTFHSLLSGSGSTGSFTANLSPLTELLVARAAGTAPATFYSNFAAGTAPSDAAVAAARDALKSLTAGLIDLTGINPIGDTLVAANGGNAGNELDTKIDKLMAALANAQTTLDAVAAAIVASPNLPDPIKTILAPTAASCNWLRSGKYRMINPYVTDPRWRAHVLRIDAAAMTATDQDGATIAVTSDGGCQFTVDEAEFTDTVMVSSAGILVVVSQSKTTALRTVTIGLPEQTLPLSELAGMWNAASWGMPDGATTAGAVASTGEIAFNSAGQITTASRCQGLVPCTIDTTGPFSMLTANATSGGFDLTDTVTGTPNGRAFLFKNLAGKAVVVVLFPDGSLLVMSRKEALGALPAVGTVSNYREFFLSGNGTVSTLTDQTTTVTAVNEVAKSVTRLRTSDSRVDTLTYDRPRDGYRYRAQGSCSFNGVVSNCAETVQLPLPGMGILLTTSAGTNPVTTFFYVSVTAPAN